MKRGIFLTILGLLQLVGTLTSFRPIEKVGAITVASPKSMSVCSVDGLEPFCSDVVFSWSDQEGEHHQLVLTPQVAKMHGRYSHRRVLSAVLADGASLAIDPETEMLFDDVSHHALTGKAPLLREVGIDPEAIEGVIVITVEPMANRPAFEMVIEP